MTLPQISSEDVLKNLTLFRPHSMPWTHAKIAMQEYGCLLKINIIARLEELKNDLSFTEDLLLQEKRVASYRNGVVHAMSECQRRLTQLKDELRGGQ